MSIQNIRVTFDYQNERLDVYLTHILADIPSRSFVKRLIDSGHVRVNEVIAKAHHKVAAGEDVSVEIPQNFLQPQHVEAEDIPLDIFYEDEHIFVINKPVGMTVHPAKGCYSGTLVNALLHHTKELSDMNDETRPGIIHRLDKETSGLMLVAKNNIAHARLARQFQRHTIVKHYVALVEGEMEFDEGIVDLPLGRHKREFDKRAVRKDDEEAKEAVTLYKVIKRGKGATFVSLFPKTGRTHQLRVHMSYLRHPILGDDKYGHPSTFHRLALHAKSIAFDHPVSRVRMEVSSVTPPEFIARIKG
jgi:23S rRNA pseudouridine1911/1915/1917 synthase